MTVIFSKKCEYGMQAVLYLAAHDKGRTISSDQISKALQIPKEFVSKILQSLRDSGLIFSTKGKSGGFGLAKDPTQIKLIDIVQAIDGLEMFSNCVLGFPECSPDTPCPVHDSWGKLRTEAFEMLSTETLDQLKDKILTKIKTLQ